MVNNLRMLIVFSPREVGVTHKENQYPNILYIVLVYYYIILNISNIKL